MNSKQQTKATLQKLGISTTAFCKNINLSRTAYYRWQADDLRLSQAKENQIRDYIKQLREVKQ